MVTCTIFISSLLSLSRPRRSQSVPAFLRRRKTAHIVPGFNQPANYRDPVYDRAGIVAPLFARQMRADGREGVLRPIVRNLLAARVRRGTRFGDDSSQKMLRLVDRSEAAAAALSCRFIHDADEHRFNLLSHSL